MLGVLEIKRVWYTAVGNMQHKPYIGKSNYPQKKIGPMLVIEFAYAVYFNVYFVKQLHSTCSTVNTERRGKNGECTKSVFLWNCW